MTLFGWSRATVVAFVAATLIAFLLGAAGATGWFAWNEYQDNVSEPPRLVHGEVRTR